MAKDYTIEKIEKPEEVIKRTNGKIALNSIFTVAGIILAGVGFGVMTGGLLHTLTAFGGVGIASASIRNLKENIEEKSKAKKELKGKSRWLK